MSERLKYIFDQLEEGVPSTEICKELDRRTAQYKDDLRRGEVSEQKVNDILAGHPMVSQIRHFPPSHPNNKKKRN